MQIKKYSITVFLFFQIYLSSSVAAPLISFTDPTPADGANLTQNYAFINTTVSDTSTAFIDWDGSLVGWWRFNNENGENSTFFRDWSSWGNNANCSGTACPASTSGKFGNALNFNGSDNYADVPNSASLNPSKITLEAWFNANSGGLRGQKPLLQKPYTSHVAPYYQYMLSLADTNKSPKSADFYLAVDGTLRWVEGKNLSYNYGEWHYLAGTYDGSTMTMYLDGNVVNTTPIVGTINSYDTVLEFGAYPNLVKNSSFVFKGIIDEVRIHSRALSPEEIKASYDAGANRLYNNFANLANGTYSYSAHAQNLSGNVAQTGRTLTVAASSAPAAPAITGFAPASPVSDNIGTARSFNISISQTVNVTWYINGTAVQFNESVTNAMYTNSSAVQGTWIVNAVAANINGSAMQTWTWSVTSAPAPGAPAITGSAPASPVSDNTGAARSFNISISQTVNVTWYINGTAVQFNGSVTDAMYTNNSAVLGTWVVNATASNANGTVSKEWTWTVTTPPPPDTTPPLLTINQPTNNQVFNASSITVSGTASDASGIASVTVNGIPATGTTAWSENVTLANGTNTIIVTATDVPGNIATVAITVTYTPSATAIPEPLAITGFDPLSPVNNFIGESRTFNITVNQTANITWLINGIQVQFNESISSASYNNTGAAGIWNVSAVASNTNGTIMQTWIWNVTATHVKGDVNDLPGLDVGDVLLTAQSVAGLKILTPAQIAAADVNGNGEDDVVDVLFIAQALAGLRQL